MPSGTYYTARKALQRYKAFFSYDVSDWSVNIVVQSGWDANEMFHTNAEKFNIRSDYDPNLTQYTWVEPACYESFVICFFSAFIVHFVHIRFRFHPFIV